jgi:hypothetical protein
MSNPEFDGPVAWDELARVLKCVRFPELGSSGYKTVPELTGDSAEHLATQLFRNVKVQREEASRWVMGSLYASDHYATPDGKPLISVYKRVAGGWLVVNTGNRFDDGSLDTQHFRRLIPEPREAGPGPMAPQVAGKLFENLAVQQTPQPPPQGTGQITADWYREHPVGED